ncbi:MAG: PAS domain S-box protein [Methanomassiliicoccus sp.]|nr:PAS domain S-box protein [Methanomassiliicoccus sp.]
MVAAVIVLLAGLNIEQPVFDPLIALILQFIFLLGVSVLVAIISAVSYHRLGSVNLILIGSAILVQGVSQTAAIWVLTSELPLTFSPNEALAIGHIGTLMASLLYLTGALATSSAARTDRAGTRTVVTVAAYLSVLLAVAILILLGYMGKLPSFLDSTGFTDLHGVTIAISITLIFVASAGFAMEYIHTRSPVLQWFSLALALVGLGVIGSAIAITLTEPITWISRICGYMAGLYLLVALLSVKSASDARGGITERWGAAFMSSRRQVDAFFANMVEVVEYCKVLADKNGKPVDYVFIDVNKAFENANGVSRERAIGRRATEVIRGLKDDPSDWIGTFGQVALKGEATSFEKFRQANGRWYYVTTYSPERGYFVAMLNDVTETKRAENALKELNVELERKVEERTRVLDEERARLRTILVNIPLAVGITDDRGGIILDNGVLPKIWSGDLALNKMNDLEVRRAWWPDSGRMVEASEWPSARALEGEASTATFDIEKFDGTRGAIVVSAIPIFNGTTLTGTVWVVQDITERKKAEEDLIKSERKYRSIGELIPFGVWTADAEGRATYISQSFGDLVGRSQEEILEFGWLDSLDPATVEETVRGWQRSVRSGTLWDRIHRVLGKDGQYHYVLARGVPFRDESGRITGWGGVNIDVTEQTLNAERLARSNAELQQFAYVASHDLQEPLRVVINYISLLNRKYGEGLDDLAKEYMAYVNSGAERMRQLVDDLLQYSRIDSQGKEFKNVDMNQVVEDVMAGLRLSVAESNASVNIEKLPTVWGDEQQLGQVFQNLVSNAIKFHGDEPPEIRISCSEGRHDWTCMIEDNGIGIDSKYQDRLFKMFQRLHTQDQYPGTGIGLAISKKIVERHGGRIWFISDGRTGTTFYISLPKRKPEGSRPDDGE